MIDKFLKPVVDHHLDTAAAFVGGAGVTLFGWWHIDPAMIVGKIVMTFVLGLVGGFAGVTAKYICNSFTKKRKPRT